MFWECKSDDPDDQITITLIFAISFSKFLYLGRGKIRQSGEIISNGFLHRLCYKNVNNCVK